jgi:transposase-like protein
MPRPKKPASPFRYLNSSPEVIRLVVMMYVRFPLSLRNVEDLLAERGIDICHETVRHWWNRFGPIFAADIKRQRISRMRSFRQWRWHLDEMYVKLIGEMVYLWRAVDQEGEVLESFVSKKRDKKAALTFMKKALRCNGRPETIMTDGPLLQGSDERTGQWQETGDRPLGEQQGGELAPAVSTKRASHAQIPANEELAEVRLGSRQCPQPLQLRTSPHRHTYLQDPPLGRAGRMAKPHGLNPAVREHRCANRRQVAVRLTAPPASCSQAFVEVH